MALVSVVMIFHLFNFNIFLYFHIQYLLKKIIILCLKGRVIEKQKQRQKDFLSTHSAPEVSTMKGWAWLTSGAQSLVGVSFGKAKLKYLDHLLLLSQARYQGAGCKRSSWDISHR